MQIKLNGEVRQFETPLTAEELLERLALAKERVVVELNMEIVPKDELGSRVLKDGDQVEVVQFVGGGAPPPAARADSAHRDSDGASRRAAGGGAKALVIVESPAKCKTIQKYLGDGYEIAASMGHVIDLPRNRMGIGIDKNFEPEYIVVKERKKTLSELKAKAKSKKEIYLACDPDREGEAISWHLQGELEGPGRKCFRVEFNEITQSAVREAFKHPREIDMDLVGAQQARRVLDRLVGYSLSPLLWQKVGRGLSAGRVQSVALRLIVDREREIGAFTPEEYWSIEAELKKTKGDPRPFRAKLERIGIHKAELKTEVHTKTLADKLKLLPFIVHEVKQSTRKRNPYPPYTTSKLQQAAYNVFRFPASKTMRIAQSLYEGVNLGEEGSVGLITYMRTDSTRLSDGALKEIRDFVHKQYGKEYLPPEPIRYKSKKSAQEAHEAIRPSSVLRRPEDIETFLSPDEFKLYGLIWRQAVACQMMPALIHQTTADIAAADCIFRATGSRIDFAGCLVVQGRSDEEENPLPALAPGEILNLINLDTVQHFTKPPPRYTDGSLVKALEEKGIGRPSTYAPTISTLTERDYARREGGSLVPSELGMLVTDLLVKHFAKVLDFEFTAKMELDLDRVEEGKTGWVKVVRSFYDKFSGEIDRAKKSMDTVKRTAEPTDEICEKCGKPMVIKWGRRGRFMSCSDWPKCKNAKSIPTSATCPQCGKGKLVERRARSGRGRKFYGCSTYPDCNFIANKLPEPGL